MAVACFAERRQTFPCTTHHITHTTSHTSLWIFFLQICVCVSRGGSCTLITSTYKYGPLVALLNTPSLKLKRGGKRQMCSCGNMWTDCSPELKTNRYSSDGGVIDELRHTHDLCGALVQDTLTCSSRQVIDWMVIKLVPFPNCRTSPFKVSHVIDYLIKRANWLISWLIFSSEHLPQRAGGVCGVGWHPVPRRGRGVFRTLLHRERPGGTAGAGGRALQQCEATSLIFMCSVTNIDTCSCVPNTYYILILIKGWVCVHSLESEYSQYCTPYYALKVLLSVLLMDTILL